MYEDQILQIKQSIVQKMQNMGIPKTSLKKDLSPVTEIDLFISQITRDIFARSEPGLHFFSEEDPQAFQFPMVVLDPIDGTREFSLGIPECALSLAIMHTPEIADPQNFAWIFNPHTGFELSSNSSFIPPRSRAPGAPAGLISRTEQARGLSLEKLVVTSRGSIAFKLGLLAAGASDFVFSHKPKHVWDIAAGTLLASQRGFVFWEKGKVIETLDRITYQRHLLWSIPEHRSFLQKALPKS